MDEKEPAIPNPEAAAAAPLPLPPLAPMPSPPGYVPPAGLPGFGAATFPLYPGYYYGPPPPRVWPVFVTFVVAFFAMQVVGAAVLLGIVALQHLNELDSPEQFVEFVQRGLADPDTLLTFLLTLQVTLLGATVVAAWLSSEPFVKRLRLCPSTLPRAAYPLVAIGAAAIGIVFELLIHFLHVPDSKELKFLSEALQHLTPWQVVAAVLVVGGAPAFGEEWFFRGYMQTRLSARWGRWPAITITAILFGVMHLNLVQGTFATVLGIYIGYLAEKSGSIRPGMLCHFTNNALQVILARYQTSWNVSGIAVGVVVGALAIVLVVAIVYMVFGVRPPPESREPQWPQPVPWYPPPCFAPPPVAWPPA